MNERPPSSPLRGSLAELPQEIAPARDLWPGIAARIAQPPQDVRSHAPPQRALAWRRGPARAWFAGLAASVAMLAIGIWVGRTLPPASAPQVAQVAQVAGGGAAVDPTTRPAAGTSGGALLAAAFSPGERYQRERARLLAQLPARLAALPPVTRQRVATSLETLERTIDELRSTLGQDPANALLQELLMNAYQDEMRVLATVDEAGAPGQET